jgi:hypothetical protein
MRDFVLPIGVIVVIWAALSLLVDQSKETDEEKAERLADAPLVACEAMLRDARRSDGEEDYRDVDENYTEGDLRYVSDLREHARAQLDGATDPDALTILRYLDHDVHVSDAIAQSGDVGAVEDLAPVGHGLLVDAVQACVDLGYPEWQEHLYEEPGSEDFR